MNSGNYLLAMRYAGTVSIILAMWVVSGCELRDWNADSPEPQGDKVTVSVASNRYSEGDTVRVVVQNHLDQEVTTTDQRSYCSIVSLEQEQGTEWTRTVMCTLNSPAREVTIEPDETTIVKLAPTPQQPSETLPPGRYRATFEYTPGEHFLPQSPETRSVVSEPFRVE